MRIAVVGGGPGGLYFSALIKSLDAAHDVSVWERNSPDDTFGFGVVLSNEALGGIEHADTKIFAKMAERFARWDDIDVHLRDTVTTVGGQGFVAMSRQGLLQILQERCAELGVRVYFRIPAPDKDELRRGYDLVVAADGANSATRMKFADVFKPTFEPQHSKYMWLGTDLVFEAFNFYVRETPHGVMQIHGYPYSANLSTFIVEMHDEVWHQAGFADLSATPLPSGHSDEKSINRVRELFADVLNGHQILANSSRWQNFTTVRNKTWRHGNLVLLGDAAHTAHFSIGSGTKLAMEDALALATCLHENDSVADGLAAYERKRRPVVLSIQRAAQASLEWFENIGHHVSQEPPQFAFNIVTRSRRITYGNLRLRDPEFISRMDQWFAGHVTRRAVISTASPGPPMFQPFRLRQVELKNRVIASSMYMCSAVEGDPGMFHMVHLGARALGGAGLVMTDMVCVSPTGRVTPGCTGMYTAQHEASWKRIVDFVHDRTTARIGIQLGHSGRKGSTKLVWEGLHEPLPAANWVVVGPSPVAYSARHQVPHELTLAELEQIKDQFITSAQAAARADFDLLELNCAHGYLLSSFLSPLSNLRTDANGGPLANRLRYPLQVFDAIRAVWPPGRAISVQILATDWHKDGNDIEDAVEIAWAFTRHGADAISVSTGQVVEGEEPIFGRSYQVPYADRIRNEVGSQHGVAVITAGNISSYDDVNSMLLAGRADLIVIGRPHLYDPNWTLHAAADQDYAGRGADWPDQYQVGRRRPLAGRNDGSRPRPDPIGAEEVVVKHSRWRPERAPTRCEDP